MTVVTYRHFQSVLLAQLSTGGTEHQMMLSFRRSAADEKEYALQKADEFARIIDADREEGEVKQIIHKGGRETFRKRYGCSYL